MTPRRSGTWLVALLFVAFGGFGTSSLAARECGGIIGQPCPTGQYCQFHPGECCCDFTGVCVDIPASCPPGCDPVCGCDGVTYLTPCEAAAAGVSVDRFGPCTPPGEEVALRGFTSTSLPRLYWEAAFPFPEVYQYNVYIADGAVEPPQFRCLYAAVPEPSVLLRGSPAPEAPWLFRVTALYPQGEGSMGLGGDCLTGRPPRPCVCTLPADPGPCDGAIPRWYHDYTTESCTTFIWGGCGGNANNFATEAECAAACQDLCTLPAVHGNCFTVNLRWYHNVLSGRCETFIWGGCDGNANRFFTEDECKAACPAPAD